MARPGTRPCYRACRNTGSAARSRSVSGRSMDEGDPDAEVCKHRTKRSRRRAIRAYRMAFVPAELAAARSARWFSYRSRFGRGERRSLRRQLLVIREAMLLAAFGALVLRAHLVQLEPTVGRLRRDTQP